MNSCWDVAVVGAGPAGAWAARGLARRGARVLLLDPSHPREKPCGGGVTGRALQLVADEVDASQLPAVTIRSARFHSPGSRHAADVELDGNAMAVARRTDFDALLLAAAIRSGAHTLAERVTDVRALTHGFEIHTRAGIHRAAAVIGADGANSLVRRRLATPFGREQLSIATGFFVHGVTSDRIEIEFVGDPPGYLWSFPRPGHLAIGVCAQADPGVGATALRRIASQWIARTGLADHGCLQPYSWPIPSLGARDFESLQPGGPGWLLVGDAGGLVDPITREGIYHALVSAKWAAEALAAAGSDGWRAYVGRVRDELGSELACAARLKHRFYAPRVTRLMIGALRQSPSVRAVMADLVAGRQAYRTLKWRLLRTWQLGLAARLLLGLESPGALESVSDA